MRVLPGGVQACPQRKSPPTNSWSEKPACPPLLYLSFIANWNRAMASKSKKRCFVVGCGEPHKSVHLLPTDQRKSAWLNFIFDGKIPPTLGKQITVCANHFAEDCFGNLGQYHAGLAHRLRLTEDTVPTIRDVSTGKGPVSIFKCVPPSSYCSGVTR